METSEAWARLYCVLAQEVYAELHNKYPTDAQAKRAAELTDIFVKEYTKRFAA